MRKRRDWIVVAVVAALLSAGAGLAGTVVPGATGKASAAGSSPSPWPSPSPSVVLQVGHNGTFVMEYTLADLEALGGGPFDGYAGYMNSGNIVYFLHRRGLQEGWAKKATSRAVQSYAILPAWVFPAKGFCSPSLVP